MTSFMSKLYTLITLQGFDHLASLLSIKLALNMGSPCMPNFVANDKIVAELLLVTVLNKIADTVCWFHALSGF